MQNLNSQVNQTADVHFINTSLKYWRIGILISGVIAFIILAVINVYPSTLDIWMFIIFSLFGVILLFDFGYIAFCTKCICSLNEERCGHYQNIISLSFDIHATCILSMGAIWFSVRSLQST